MQPKKLLVPFVFGLCLVPGFIVLHEAGHYIAASALGLDPRFEYAEVKLTLPASESQRAAVVASGPLVELVLTLVGVIWLSRLRSDRRHLAPTARDWLATGCALAAARWLRCFTGTPANPKPADEAFLSQFLGLPSWVLPYALAPLAVAAIVYVIRLHPAKMRLLPFSVVFAAGLGGLFLWLTAVGPWIFPLR
jgi:hypothetical protein